MLRIIREEEPPRPSTKLSSSETLPSVSANRSMEPTRLSRTVRGELDWIVMKALEKDRNRRYETANGFAMDIQRYLADEPVLACPPSAAYRVKKFARRNKGSLAAALLVAVSGIGWAVRDRSAQRAERLTRTTAQVELILADVDGLMNQQKWDAALAVAKRAEAALAGGEADAATAERVGALLKDLEFMDRLEQIRMQEAMWVNDSGFDDAAEARAYAAAFRDYGVDVNELAVEASIEQLKPRSALAVPIAAALDSWALARRNKSTGNSVAWKRLVAVARGIDPEPLRDRIRATFGQPGSDQKLDELRRVAELIDVRVQHPATLQRLAVALLRNKESDAAHGLLRDAQAAYPGDFWLNFLLAESLTNRMDHEGAVRFYTAAVSLRPHAVAAHCNLGGALDDQKKLDEAIAAYRRAIELDPKGAVAHSNLGNALGQQNKLDEAVAACRTAIELDPKLFDAHFNLGAALHRKDRSDEAITAYRKAIEFDTKHGGTYVNLGVIFWGKRDYDGAITCFRKAIELNPKDAGAISNLGNVLCDKKEFDEAITCFRKVIELNPIDASVISYLGNALCNKKEFD